MTTWIANVQGVKALVADEDVAEWTGMHGWSVSTEPAPTDQTYIVHPDGLTGCVPFESLAGGWADLGWTPGPPPTPVDTLRDPEPAPGPVREPVAPEEAARKPKTQSAAGGVKSEE